MDLDNRVCDTCGDEQPPRRPVLWRGEQAWCCIDCIARALGGAQAELEQARRDLGLLREATR